MALLTAWEADYALPSDVIKGGLRYQRPVRLGTVSLYFVQSSLQLTWDKFCRTVRFAAPLLISYVEQEPDEFRRQSDEPL